MLRRILAAMAVGTIMVTCAAPARADVIDMIVQSHGHYALGGVTLDATDCSGLVGFAQTAAEGQEPHRLGNTRDFLAGNWPDLLPGAVPEDRFIIAANDQHMVAQVDGVNIESNGGPYRIGDQAHSPWNPEFPARFHVDPTLLVP